MQLMRTVIRKDYQGNIISETAQPLPGSPDTEIRFLGQVLAQKLQHDFGFQTFCKGEPKNFYPVPLEK